MLCLSQPLSPAGLRGMRTQLGLFHEEGCDLSASLVALAVTLAGCATQLAHAAHDAVRCSQ